MKVSFSKSITKKWKSHIHGWLLAKPLNYFDLDWFTFINAYFFINVIFIDLHLLMHIYSLMCTIFLFREDFFLVDKTLKSWEDINTKSTLKSIKTDDKKQNVE